MEVEDSLEVPNLKAGSRSNSRELLDRESNETSETETSGDTSDKGVISNDKDLPNGAEHDGSSKEDKAEEEAGDGNDILAGQENPPVEDTSRGDSPREEDSSKKEDSCDKVVEEESHSNVARSDVAMESENSTGSENWRLNIDTSGTTTPSGQGVSEGEDLAEESKANGKESPTEQDDLSSDEAFPGFEDIPTCLPDGHSILKNIIEKLERNEFLSANSNKEENLSDSVEFTVTNNEASSSSKKISLSVNFDDSKIDMSTVKSSNQHLPSARLIKESKNQSTESSSFIHSSMDTSPKVDTVNTAEMMGSEEVTSSTTSSPSLGSGHSGRGKKIHVDVSNPAFRKPMELGWKRELVYRNTSDVGMKRMADIYYYTPLGKKVRSNREVVENLIGDELTLENFTFFKEPLGINDPTKEIIRDAKRVAQKEAVGTPPKKIPKLASQKATTKEGQLSSKPIVVLFKDPNISSIGTGTRETTPPTAGSSSKPKPMTRAFPRIKVTPLRSQRPSMMGTPTSSKPTSGSKLKRDVDDSGELEMGMLHPMWRDPSNLLIHKKAALTSPQLSTPSPGAKGTPSSSSKNFSLSILKSSTAKENSSSVEEVRSSKLQTDDHFMQFFMQNLGAGYMALIEVFKYLKVQELLRAGRVCRMWHDLTGQALLWKTVRMKNSQVVDWKGCADSLRRYGTEELDLRKMLVTGQSNEMWEEFCVAMGTIPTLRRLELCKCPASVIERLTQECSQLQSITALALRCPNISLRFMNNLKNLKELRLKSIQGIDLNSKLDVLQNLTNLKHLSLTTFTELGRMGPSVIGTLTSLESLELGDFCDFPESFGSTLLHLNKLQRLRLEKGQGKLCPTFKVLAGVQELPCLTQLELVNFDIKAGFDQALAQCTNLRRLLIIPTYVTQSATTNHMVLGGVTKLGASLVDFVWGVTHELLRVTELFVDQCDAQKGARLTPKSSKKNGTGESIPVLRPVPGLIEDPLSDAGSDKSAGSKHNLGKDENGGEGIKPSAAAQQQVDILPLSKLQTLLNTALPNAKVKILRIPFQSTWRQSIGEHSH